MNVLVYSGPGTTIESVKHCTESLRKVLSPFYAVVNVNAKIIKTEPWTASTALIVIPGGADLPYCRELNGAGNNIIRKYVRSGGRYIGFCAGGYYGSSRCEFEVGDPEMEVSGSRELAFYPGVCRGSAFKGFKYGSHVGAKATLLKVNRKNLLGRNEAGPDFKSDEASRSLGDFSCYFNGGGTFVDAELLESQGTGVEVLAEYTEPLDVEATNTSGKEVAGAAAVYCKFGKGSAVLTGVHPEFGFLSSVSGKAESDSTDSVDKDVVDAVNLDNSKRLAFLRCTLAKMGLKVNWDDSSNSSIPQLTRLKLTSLRPATVQSLISHLKNEIGFTGEDGNLLVGQNDTFRIILEDSHHPESEGASESGRRTHLLNYDVEVPEDLNKVIKDIEISNSSRPNHRDTPYFNHQVYYENLEALQTRNNLKGELGSILLYGEVVTSTSTMLDKNYSLLRHLPNGFTAVGTIQVSGRGRGNNVWVNPPGVLAVSGVLRMPMGVNTPSIIFVQYLVSLAVVEAILDYGPGYQEMPVHLKWPNDVYAKSPPHMTNVEEYLKIAGVIVNSNIFDSEYVLVYGAGTNVSNPAPTVSLNVILNTLNEERHKRGQAPLPNYNQEVLLANFVTKLEEMLNSFKYQGFTAFKELYYKRWLHTDKIVTLEQYDNTKAIVRGITSDFGLLEVEEVDRNNNPTGRKYELQPDGNSFDMFKGLLKKKN
ncbi:biotin--[acetyl-CoA-carboxylase] ligase BPL1 [Sugiyamaella lignohabitans]|uniref:Biotin--[acetyl-CoA-carboxylase] ligase BPL1 n=1 Tax=Sugiyamaella lignohabitans TaxID=796027 RepID=A0A161HJW8_9ASCO|nr:biotin--[acetyl-CoA-carboxylase] ligase BPL1 [Sugiyamaella lignohabitans]ANB13117.1 biotin--[acetyl-CoA-carboxylase] ligase BPL1 [Sugiyamaella lignohabitans]